MDLAGVLRVDVESLLDRLEVRAEWWSGDHRVRCGLAGRRSITSGQTGLLIVPPLQRLRWRESRLVAVSR
jgi:hypothetical protein